MLPTMNFQCTKLQPKLQTVNISFETVYYSLSDMDFVVFTFLGMPPIKISKQMIFQHSFN